MKNFVCWDKENIPTVMDPEAEYVPDHVFAAVHHPVVMKKASGGNDIPYSQEELLQDFTDKENSHLFVPILGVSGSGKSHLIRWLKTHISSVPGKQEVILIPKAGTNLKDIIRLILRNREGGIFDEYRKRLDQALQQIDDAAGRSLLLDKLAHQISFLPSSYFSNKMMVTLPNKEALTEYVKKLLPDLLRDPYIRSEYWLKEGGVIERLYDQAVGTSQKRERLDKPRQFVSDDIPLEPSDFGQAGSLAIKSLGMLRNKQMREIALSLLNSSLNEAIRELLIGGEDLTRLLLDVRRQLYKEGITLILLIEDFAKTQGIDGALLDALIQRSRSEDPLCIMRSALACTDGYYENIPDTVKNRASYTIKISYDDKAAIDYDAFVALYLNAGRLGSDRLKSDFHEFQSNNNLHHEWKAPNHCLSCEYKPSCHANFGSYNGIGLYPFNEVAAREMYLRVNASTFNPRKFIGSVLNEVMYRHALDIKDGNFPNSILQEKFGGGVSKLETIDMKNISNYVKNEKKAEQIFRLIEYWSNNQNAIKPGILEAFGLPLLPVNLNDTSVDPLPLISPTPPNTSPSDKKPKHYKQLESWRDGAKPDQESRRDVTKLLHEAIINHINWDKLGLIKSEFVISGKQGGDHIFSFDKIQLLGKTENKEISKKIQLQLPIDERERKSSALALQGLVLYTHFGSWDFDINKNYFLAFSRHIKQWSQIIIDQMLTFSQEDKEWNPLMGTIQWMYFIARISGKIKHDDTSLVDIWDRINENFTFTGLEYRDENWKKLCTSLEENKEKLFNLFFTQSLCSKGEPTQITPRNIKYFDIIKVIPLLQQVYSNNKLYYFTPIDVTKKGRYSTLVNLDQAYNNSFDKALNQEMNRFIEWFDEFFNGLGNPIQKEVENNLKQIELSFEDIESDGKYGILLKNDMYVDIRKFLKRPPLRDIDVAYRNASHIKKLAEESERNLPELVSRIGRGDILKVMSDSQAFIQNTSKIFSAIQQSIQKSIENKKMASEGNIDSFKLSIQNSLNLLLKLEERIGELH